VHQRVIARNHEELNIYSPNKNGLNNVRMYRHGNTSYRLNNANKAINVREIEMKSSQYSHDKLKINEIDQTPAVIKGNNENQSIE